MAESRGVSELIVMKSKKQKLRSQTAKEVLTEFVAHIHKPLCSRECKVRIFSSSGLIVALLSVGDTQFVTKITCFEEYLIGPQLHQCAHVGSANW